MKKKNLMIYFTRYYRGKSVRIFSLFYHKLMGKIKELEEKIFHGWWLLGKIIKIIVVEKFDDTKMLIKTDNKLPDEIILKNVVILITCVIKNGDKFYPQIFFEEALISQI